jgi:3-methyladenine DNA glycosylase AlkD
MDEIKSLRNEIKKSANPQKVKILQKFFKTGKGQYGEGDIFIGLMVPESRKISKKYLNLTFKEILILLSSKIHEERLICLLILVDKFKKATQNEQEKIFRFYIKHAKKVNNWDLVDLSAPNILGTYLLGTPDRQILYKLARSDNIWKKRISIIATLTFIRNAQFDDTLRLAEILIFDNNDLIHKAVGWMLREVGKRDEILLEQFLEKYCKVMPRTTLRYAIEKFSKQKRKNFLEMKNLV